MFLSKVKEVEKRKVIGGEGKISSRCHVILCGLRGGVFFFGEDGWGTDRTTLPKGQSYTEKSRRVVYGTLAMFFSEERERQLEAKQ